MRKIVLILALLALLTLRVSAQELLEQEAEILGTQTLEDGLDGEARSMLDGVSPSGTADFGKELTRMLGRAVSGLETPLHAALRTGCMLLAVVLLCAVCGNFELELPVRSVTLGGALGITAVCTVSLRSMIGLAADTLDRVGTFTTMLLPVMSAALTASGGMTSGSALYVGSTLFMDVLVRLIRSVLIPMTYAFVAVSTAECAAGDGRLSQLRECIGWFIRLALKGVVALFTAYLAITGIASGSADAAAVKAAGSALGAAVPVVGGMLSDAAGSILAGANFLKTTAGIFGMLALAAIGMTPFLQIGVHYLVLKLTAAVGGTVASGAHAKLLENLSSAMGYMLAMTGSSILMAMISCCCFMKAVNV